MARMPKIMPEDIQERIRDAYRLHRKLSVWLDQQPVTCPSCDHSYPAGTWNGNSHACPGCRALYWIGIAAG